MKCRVVQHPFHESSVTATIPTSGTMGEFPFAWYAMDVLSGALRKLDGRAGRGNGRFCASRRAALCA
jgi:hypothetical protein